METIEKWSLGYDIIVLRFPRCPDRKEKWIEAMHRGEGWFPTKNSVVCSTHFSDDSFHYMKNHRRLMDSVIPTLYLPVLAPATTTKNASVPTSAKNNESGASSSKISISSSPQNNRENSAPDTTIQIEKVATSPSAYNSPVEKRLCRRIIELSNIVKTKNKKIKRMYDTNRRLKNKIVSLKSLLSKIHAKRKVNIPNRDVDTNSK